MRIGIDNQLLATIFTSQFVYILPIQSSNSLMLIEALVLKYQMFMESYKTIAI